MIFSFLVSTFFPFYFFLYIHLYLYFFFFFFLQLLTFTGIGCFVWGEWNKIKVNKKGESELGFCGLHFSKLKSEKEVIHFDLFPTTKTPTILLFSYKEEAISWVQK
jgi:hypothetical protein